MKNFEKRIIKLCKTTNVEKILFITSIILIMIMLLGTSMKFPRVINVLIASIILALLIINKIVRTIKKTDIEIFSENNFWYVIFSDSDVCEMICYVVTMFIFYNISGKIIITTGSLFWNIIIALLLVAGVFFMSDKVAKFFKNRLK